MKALFVMMSMFALLVCMAIPTYAGASVVTDTHWDNDVGLTNGTVIAPNFTAETTPTMPSIGHLDDRSHLLLMDWYWCGGDSKASRCEAVYSKKKSAQIAREKYDSTDFGKGTKRLSCEAKA